MQAHTLDILMTNSILDITLRGKGNLPEDMQRDKKFHLLGWAFIESEQKETRANLFRCERSTDAEIEAEIWHAGIAEWKYLEEAKNEIYYVHVMKEHAKRERSHIFGLRQWFNDVDIEQTGRHQNRMRMGNLRGAKRLTIKYDVRVRYHSRG